MMTSGRSIEDVLRSAEDAVFLLRSGNGIGTGFVVSSDGHLLTCRHVIHSETIEIVSSNGDIWQSPVLAQDPLYDLAMLQISQLQVPCLTFADPISIQTGQRVFALGHPLGLDFTVSQGIISNRNRLIQGASFIQTDVALNPGNSGGPILNENGEVIGVANSMISIEHAQGLGFAIALRYIFAFASQLRIKLQRAREFTVAG
ncbi:MAG: trypsin-like peptidase domain-containing protein [Candidatus Vecturithrix sp.]|nr:trypsin-like peptidase domain-containing protein [Candidatus Vecturithrix sp.]